MSILSRIYLENENIQWNEVSLCSIDPNKVVFQLSKSNENINIGEIIFNDYIYVSVAREGDRYLEFFDVMKEVKFLHNFVYEFRPSPIIEKMKNMLHKNTDSGFRHYVIVDEDNWYDIISNVGPYMRKL